MKNYLILAFALFSVSCSHACDRSYLTLDSIVPVGPDYELHLTLCIGAGITGVTKGGDASTSSFAFGIYGTGVTMNAFGPVTITGAETGCVMSAFDVGPQPGAPFYSDATLFYSDPGCPNAFTCVSSTATCGDVHTECGQYVITTNVIPDSIRVFGIEGSGNPAAGCFPNSDMMVDIATWLGVEWTDLKAEAIDARTRRISWKTISEENNDYFDVQRIGAHDHHWETLGRLDGAGNSTSPLEYTFLDEVHLLGETVYYRLKQVDYDGASKYSSMMSVAPLSDQPTLSLVPNPASNFVTITGLSENDFIHVTGADGATIPLAVDENGTLHTQRCAPGVYFVSVSSELRQETLKLVIE